MAAPSSSKTEILRYQASSVWPWVRWLFGTMKILESAEWASFAGADWAKSIMDVEVTDRRFAKQGRGIGRWILQHQGRRLSVYLKRHYQLSWWRGVLAWLWPWRDWSPGMQEARRLLWAQGQGLPVPRVWAAGEAVRPGGKLTSFLAVEELADMVPLHEAIPLAAQRLPPTAFRRWKRGLAAEMARLTRFLHQRRRFHKDLYLCHFFIAQDDVERPPADWQQRVHLIDFHRLTWHPLTSLVWRVKDLGQLLYSARVEGIDERDHLWFWRCYLGPGRKARLLRWLVTKKGGLYRKHNQKRRERRAA